mmetsp:Transcript_5623/g.34881  ORF Transcript_5623/g.34881 Transcript_5623/m.34881 type:complete len:94 (+) Transcript_5623:1781-2062(+)
MQNGGCLYERGATTKNPGAKRQRQICEELKVQQKWILLQPREERQQEMPLWQHQVLRNVHTVQKRAAKAEDEAVGVKNAIQSHMLNFLGKLTS